MSWNIAYVGSHGTRLWGIDNINQPTAGLVAVPSVAGSTTLCNQTGGTKLSTAACEQISRPYYFAAGQGITETSAGPVVSGGASLATLKTLYPWFAKINYVSNLFQSNYNGLQTSLTQRLSHGVTMNVSYTWAHALGDGSTDEYFPQNSMAPGLEYGNDLNDIRHRVTITGSYAIPGRPGFAQMLQGWQINTAIGLTSALPLEMVDTNSDLSGRGDTGGGFSSSGAPALRWDLFGNPSDFKPGAGAIPCYSLAAGSFAKSCTVEPDMQHMPQACVNNDQGTLAAFGCYATAMVGGSAIVPPARGAFGTMTLDEIRGKGFRT